MRVLVLFLTAALLATTQAPAQAQGLPPSPAAGSTPVPTAGPAQDPVLDRWKGYIARHKALRAELDKLKPASAPVELLKIRLDAAFDLLFLHHETFLAVCKPDPVHLGYIGSRLKALAQTLAARDAVPPEAAGQQKSVADLAAEALALAESLLAQAKTKP